MSAGPLSCQIRQRKPEFRSLGGAALVIVLGGCAARLSEPADYQADAATACANDIEAYRHEIKARGLPMPVEIPDHRQVRVRFFDPDEAAGVLAAARWVEQGAWACFEKAAEPPTVQALKASEWMKMNVRGSPYPWWTAATYAFGQRLTAEDLRTQELRVRHAHLGPVPLITMNDAQWDALVQADDDQWFRAALRQCLRSVVPTGEPFDERRQRERKRDELNACLEHVEAPESFAAAVEAQEEKARQAERERLAAEQAAHEAEMAAQATLSDQEITDGKCDQERFDLLQEDLDYLAAALKQLAGNRGFLRDHQVHVLDGTPKPIELRAFVASQHWIFLRGFEPVDLDVRDASGNEYRAKVNFQRDDGLHLGLGPALAADTVVIDVPPGETVQVKITGRGCAMLSVFRMSR